MAYKRTDFSSSDSCHQPFNSRSNGHFFFCFIHTISINICINYIINGKISWYSLLTVIYSGFEHAHVNTYVCDRYHNICDIFCGSLSSCFKLTAIMGNESAYFTAIVQKCIKLHCFLFIYLIFYIFRWNKYFNYRIILKFVTGKLTLYSISSLKLI